MRGGYSDHGAYCGAFCIDSAEPASYFYWAFGAALSFILHIILFVAAIVMMVFVVVYYLFQLMDLFLLLTGLMVLLYLYFILYSSWRIF